MNVLLLSIDAKYIHTNNAVRLLKANSSFPVDVHEYTIKDPLITLQQDVLKRKWDVIGFSVYIWNVEIVKSILKTLESSKAFIILGGPEVSYDPEHFLSYSAVDVIVRGEGELVFNTLLQRINNNQTFEDLPNIAFRKDETIVQKPIEEIQDLSVLKSPYFFEEDIPHMKHRIAYIESSRGCPYHCSYCLSSLEKSVRFFPVETVKQAISYIMNHGGTTIKFLDRTFNANNNTIEILDFIIQQDNLQTVFQFEITGDILSPTILEYIHTHARKGLFRFEIGIQSTNETTNFLVDRHQNTEKLFDRITAIQDAGIIDLHLDLIAGLPKEDKASFINTFDSVFFLGAKELQLGFLKMLRGTKIRTFSELYNYTYHPTAPYEIISNDVLSKRDILEIKGVEHMLEMYHNKGYFGEHLHSYILSLQSPYGFFKKLATHYKKNKYAYHGYQIVDVYKQLLEVLPKEIHYNIYKDYLKRSKIKPHIFFDNEIDRPTKRLLFEQISKEHNIPIHLLYKHSVLIHGTTEYFCAFYQHNTCIPYIVKAPN